MAAGIRPVMRSLPLLVLVLAGCSSTKQPGNSRVQEQARLNAVTSPENASRAEEIMRLDRTKEFNLGAATFGRHRSVATKGAQTNQFYFVDKTRTKGFATHDFTTKEARDSAQSYGTKAMPTTESQFSGRTARTKDYPTAESRDAGRTAETRALPGGDRAFVAQGRKQASLDKDGAAKHPMGGDRNGVESWSGELKPLTIQDVKALLNKN
jgi:hypothetical protein